MKSICFLILISLSCSFYSYGQIYIYVSPNGSADASGSIEDPLGTLLDAQKTVRALLEKSSETIIVNIMGGEYNLSETLVFSLDDGGENEQQIIWQGIGDQIPVITAGVEIQGWKKSKGPAGIPVAAHGKIWEASLPEGVGLFKTMYEDGIALKRARGKGFKSRIDALGRDDLEHLRSRNLMYVDNQTAFGNWSNISDLELVIRPFCLWTMNILPISNINTEKRTISTAINGSYYLTKERYQRFSNEHAWIENIPEGMTGPGTWCVNTQEGKIYFWPGSGRPGIVTVPVLQEFIRVEGEIDYDGPVDKPVRNIHFRNLKLINNERDTWTKNDKGIQHDWEMMDKGNAFLRFRGAEHCSVENCEFAQGGGSGIRLDLHAQHIKINNNYIHDIGGTGILLCGYGAGTKDVNKFNDIDNNCIQRIGLHYWHNAGITVTQSGENRISHNLITETPYNGISVTGYRLSFFTDKRKAELDKSVSDPNYFAETAGNSGMNLRENTRCIRYDEIRRTNTLYASHQGEHGDQVIRELLKYQPFIHSRMNIIEYNEVSHVLQILGDGNGLYISDPGPYNVIRNNFFHHAEGVHGVAIRTDHLTHNTLVESNIIWKFAGGLAISHNNQAVNNIIADVGGLTMTEGDRNDTKRIEVVIDYSRTGGYQDGLILQNIGYQPADKTPYFGNLNRLDTSMLNVVDDNYFYWDGHYKQMVVMLDSLKLKGFDKNSMVVDPLFVAPQKGDFSLKPESPLPANGFKEIDQKKIGLKKNFPFIIKTKL